jgi:hypothetical protein
MGHLTVTSRHASEAVSTALELREHLRVGA